MVVAELLMVGDEQFECYFDPIHAAVATSVGFGHINQSSAAGGLRNPRYSAAI